MMKVSQKELKGMVIESYVTDITYGTDTMRSDIMNEEGYLDTVAYSMGAYGCNGRLYRGHNTGRMYVITGRTSALFLFG